MYVLPLYEYIAKIPREEIDWSWGMRYFSGENNNACLFSCCTGHFFWTTTISSSPPSAGGRVGVTGLLMGAPLVRFPPYGLSSPRWQRVLSHYWEKLHILCKQWTSCFVPPICKKNMWGFVEATYGSTFLAPSSVSSVQTPALCISHPWRAVWAPEWRASIHPQKICQLTVSFQSFSPKCAAHRERWSGEYLPATHRWLVGQEERASLPQYDSKWNPLAPKPTSPLTPNEIETSDHPITVGPHSFWGGNHLPQSALQLPCCMTLGKTALWSS